jgi:hypothetical protein
MPRVQIAQEAKQVRRCLLMSDPIQDEAPYEVIDRESVDQANRHRAADLQVDPLDGRNQGL